MALFRRVVFVAAWVCGGSPGLAQDSGQPAAESMREKLEFIVDLAGRARPAPPVRTSFTDDEINAYLETYGATVLPDGIADPRIRIGEGGRVTARGLVDLDAVRKSRERAWNDPLSYVTGSVEVVATGVLSSTEGLGVAAVESVTLGGLTVPQTLLEELIHFYTRTPERPQGFNLDEPFALPASIRRVVLESGRATVTQ
jgi:hypothetical protein